MSIENTQSPDSRHATALLALATGDPSAVIEAQERAGQAQLVHSDRLPAQIEVHSDTGDQAGFEALGFTFGDPDPKDPLFRPATLPEGWKREASDHDMWSYIVDQLGRRRVSVFYKAAFYDRRAFMGLTTVAAYVSACQYDGVDVVTDDAWATPAAVSEAARRWAQRAEENAERWAQGAPGKPASKDAERYATEYRAERDGYLAIAAKHTTN